MATLTLFCPTLFPPGDHDPGVSPDLPALEALLARARRLEEPCEHEYTWLCRRFDVAAQPDWPSAALSMRAFDYTAPLDFWLHADPVQLSVDRDRLVLARQVRIDDAEARALLGSLNRHFSGEGLEFFAPEAQGWFLRSAEAPDLRTTPLALALGRDIDSLLPGGAQGARWRTIFNEAQMLLHEHPVNEERERRGETPLNSLWFWGGGRLPKVEPRFEGLAGRSALLRGLGAQSGARVIAPEQGFGALAGDNTLAELVEDPVFESFPRQQTLLAWEGGWFRPALDALRSGQLSEVRFITLSKGLAFEWRRRKIDAWKLWRHRRPLNSIMR